ncbi:MAG: hypothetical protein FJ179_03190 [Gammaproteobacteria bacterium]|nr:hypothetical protein [Gammaproteobacteria bacterium]
MKIRCTITLLIALAGLTACATVSVSDPLASNKPVHSFDAARTRGDPWRPNSRVAAVASSRGPESSRDPSKYVTIQQLGESATSATSAPSALPAPSGSPAQGDLLAYGFASITAQSGGDAALRRLQAARAAKLDAYRNLAEQLHGFEFAGESLIEDGRVREDRVRARLSGMIHGAEVVALETLGNDSYQATVRLPAARIAEARRTRP